jgi:uncharacterized protein
MINEEINSMADLQNIDLEIMKLETSALELQQGHEIKKKEIDELTELISQQKVKLQQYEVKLHDFGVDHASLKERLTKYQEQRNFIKKPRELFAIDKEIETTLKAIRVNETEQKKTTLEHDNFKTNCDQDLAKLELKNTEIAQIEASLKDRIASNAEEISKLKLKRVEVKKGITEENMGIYEFITKKKGVALSEVVNEACGQCYISLPPQLINEIKRGDKVVRCTSCARILYLK